MWQLFLSIITFQRESVTAKGKKPHQEKIIHGLNKQTETLYTKIKKDIEEFPWIDSNLI